MICLNPIWSHKTSYTKKTSPTPKFPSRDWRTPCDPKVSHEWFEASPGWDLSICWGSIWWDDGIFPSGPKNIESSWWLNQPIWKICSSKWDHLRQVVVNIKHIWNHHLGMPPLCGWPRKPRFFCSTNSFWGSVFFGDFWDPKKVIYLTNPFVLPIAKGLRWTFTIYLSWALHSGSWRSINGTKNYWWFFSHCDRVWEGPNIYWNHNLVHHFPYSPENEEISNIPWKLIVGRWFISI